MALDLIRSPGYPAQQKNDEEENKAHEAELREKLKELSSGPTTTSG